MAVDTLYNARVRVGSLNVTGFSNEVSIEVSPASNDATVFGNTHQVFKPGLAMTKISAKGFQDYAVASIDEVLRAQNGIGFEDILVTVCPTPEAAGDLIFFAKVMQSNYKPLPGMAIGQIGQYSLECMPTSESLVRGNVSISPNAALTATTNGTGIQLGALSANQRLIAAISVASVSGTSPSLTPKVQSDDNSGFTSPTDRVTGSAITAKGYQVLVVNGPITDDRWRIVATISGTSPSFVTLAALGIVSF